MPFAEFFGGPFQLAINDEDRPAGFEILLDETLVGMSQPKSLDSKISHALDHQPILIWIMHVVQLHIGIRFKESRNPFLRPFHILLRLIGMRAGARNRYEKRLGKPRDSECRP